MPLESYLAGMGVHCERECCWIVWVAGEIRSIDCLDGRDFIISLFRELVGNRVLLLLLLLLPHLAVKCHTMYYTVHKTVSDDDQHARRRAQRCTSSP